MTSNDSITLIEGSLDSLEDVINAVSGQDIVFAGVVDNVQINNVVTAMKNANVNCLIYTNVLNIYYEVLGEYGEWSKSMIGNGLPSALKSDQIMEQLGLNYITLRVPWLNNREVKYDA